MILDVPELQELVQRIMMDLPLNFASLLYAKVNSKLAGNK